MIDTPAGVNKLASLAARGLCLATVGLVALHAGLAHAQTAPAPAPAAPAAPAAPWKSPTWSDFTKSIKYTAVIEGGISYDPQRGPDSYNFGQLFTDKGNTVQLNQALFTAERDTDPMATSWDYGFKLQGLFGSDARYVHYLGEFTHVTDMRDQPEILEANVSVHVPLLFASGIDLKVGQFPTPEGFEVIAASGNPFYSHSYIFNFGLPFVATGALAVVHVSPMVDIYLEADTGLNTTFGHGDENKEPAGLAGFNLTLMGGKLTMLALSHFGPENSTKVLGNAANQYFRYLNDAVITYKPTTKLTLVTEVNYSREDYFRAEAWGVTQYVAYPLSDTVTFNGRAEVFRDSENFFVAGFPGNQDYVNAQLGNPSTAIFASRRGTYSEATVGLSFAPKVPGPLASLTIRPELRYDRSLDNARPYAGNKDNGALTVAADAIIGF